MLCLYLTIALCMTGILQVSLGASFNPGLTREKGLRRLHKREVPVPRSISNVTRAAKTQGEEKKGYKARKTQRRFNDDWEFAPGIALIEDDNNRPFCTGVHLKPWIILTTAECVEEQDPYDLRVTIVFGRRYVKYRTVDVDDVIVNPDYVEGEGANNQALVIANVRKAWKVDTFNIPPDSFTYEDLTAADTYLHDWDTFNRRKNEYISETPEVQVTGDYDICYDEEARKKKNIERYLYCCDREGYSHTCHWYDNGSPLFYLDDDEKPFVAGLYAGDNAGEEMAGHWVWSILPNRDWLRKEIEKNPRPRV